MKRGTYQMVTSTARIRVATSGERSEPCSLGRALSNPPLEAPVAGLVGWIATRQIAPRSTGTKDPKDRVEHFSRVPPGTPPAIRVARRHGDQGSYHVPLLVSYVRGLMLLFAVGQ